MITQALRHCAGIGPARLAQLHALGICSWHDVLADPERVPARLRAALVADSRRALQALEQDDIPFFVERLHPHDKWRILTRYLERTTFFDIETTGLEYDAAITVIVCWHRGRLHTFVEHENLDDFLDLLEEVELLASFNGSTFDVPRVLQAFHVPDLPCPHLDLRWSCHHRGMQGGLKAITSRLGLKRPPDLAEADGDLAIRLWWEWHRRRDRTARDLLIRYCAADVLLLRALALHLAEMQHEGLEDLWTLLPGDLAKTGGEPRTCSAERGVIAAREPFGAGSPARLRARRAAS